MKRLLLILLLLLGCSNVVDTEPKLFTFEVVGSCSAQLHIYVGSTDNSHTLFQHRISGGWKAVFEISPKYDAHIWYTIRTSTDFRSADFDYREYVRVPSPC